MQHPNQTDSPTLKPTARARRIMYLECKSDGLTGPARIGRVTFSKTGRTPYYKGRKFQSFKGRGFKSNYHDVESHEHYWMSGPKRNGQDALYICNSPVEIDDDIRVEYWCEIRRLPKRVNETTTSLGLRNLGAAFALHGVVHNCR